MTDEKLRKTAEKSAIPTETAPLNDDFVHMHAMLSALDGGVPDERTVTALLLGWALDGQIILCETKKKRLKSFGAAQQATILFPGGPGASFRPAVSGAEGLLLGLLYGWADETATVQESELYNLAREYHDAVQGRLEQFRTQGRHGLRALGAMLPEKKTRKFGFVDENRPIYTPRGVREEQICSVIVRGLVRSKICLRKNGGMPFCLAVRRNVHRLWTESSTVLHRRWRKR